MRLPKLDKLVIPVEKLSKYSLDTINEPDKALAFKLALGFNASDVKLLIEKIKLGVTIFSATDKQICEWGQRYQVIIKMKGHGEKTANVLTAWIDDKITDEMRLTSAYITNKEVLVNDADKTV